MRFPPGKSGGLIEATDPMRYSTSSISSFRRVNPAASLKHRIRHHGERPDGPGFRRVNPADSLKRDNPGELLRAAQGRFRR